MDNIEYTLYRKEFINLYSFEESLYDTIEGNLDFNKRRILVIFDNEKELLKLYQAIFDNKSGWRIKFENNKINKIDYIITPNAITIYTKLKNETSKDI